MNCAHIRERLPLLAYDEVEPAEAVGLRAHLAACPSCQRELAAWQHMQRKLDAVPTPPTIAADVPALYRRLAQRQERRSRGWKWAACLAMATAAGLAALFLLRGIELRVDGEQLVLRWGTPLEPRIEEVPVPPKELASGPTAAIAPALSSAKLEDQLAVLSQIVRALAKNAEEHATEQQQELALLRARLDSFQRRHDVRLADLERDFRTLYKVHFVLKEKGDTP